MWSWESSSQLGISNSNRQLIGNPIACGRTDPILVYAMDVVELHLHNIDWSSVHSVVPDTNCTFLCFLDVLRVIHPENEFPPVCPAWILEMYCCFNDVGMIIF